MKLTLCFLTLSLSLPLLASNVRNFHPNHLFIKVKDGFELPQNLKFDSKKNIFGNLYLVSVKNPSFLEESLKNNPAIEYTQKDFYGEKTSAPKLERLDSASAQMKFNQSLDFMMSSFNDPQASKLWAFGDKSGMSVESAYANLPNVTPMEVIVAVVDTGVDHRHEDLKDVMWVNTAEIPGDKIDNDKNGYVDDVHGINTLVRDAQGKATGDTMGSHWHGTHVAGTIAATQNNGVGIAGVANNVKIMAIRTVPDDADELDSNIVEAFKYAAQNGARVINCSFGKSKNEGGMVVRDVINEISKKGVLVVASAGNDSMGPFSWHDNDKDPKYPASFDSQNLMVIASTTNSGGLSSFSNVGKKSVDIASPGSNIFSTVKDNGYGMASGTSMAAPNASGVAAMVLGYFPHLSPVELKEVLMKSSVKVEEFKSKTASGGRINLKTALEYALTK